MKITIALLTEDGEKHTTTAEMAKAQSRGRPVSPVYVYMTEEQLTDFYERIGNLLENGK